MSLKKKYKEQQPDLSKTTNEMIAGITIDWSKSREQVWSEIEKQIDNRQRSTKVTMTPWIRYAVAAAVTILAGLAVFMQVYTKNIRVPSGLHSQCTLPDGSQVQVNAQSALSFKPWLWKFSRSVKLEGEAWFEVEPGKRFEVVSENGTTTVLGTRFNVYARKHDYRVTCVSGKVKVTVPGSTVETILLPGQKAALNPSGLIDVESGVNTEQSLSWLNNRLSFTSVPLAEVFEEIGRQYGIRVVIPGDLDHIYTGTFMRDTSVEQALDLVCKPFNLTFTRKAENEYIVSKSK